MLAAALSDSRARGSDLSDDRIQQWFWTRSFGETFRVAANTVAETEYRLLVGDAPIQPVRPVVRADLVAATRSSNGALYRSMVSAFASDGVLNGTGAREAAAPDDVGKVREIEIRAPSWLPRRIVSCSP